MKPPLEHLFAIYASKTFGPKIDCFKAWCAPASVSEKNRPLLDRVYKDLESLLPQRNFIIHGETWDGALGGKPRQPYRIGVTADNLDYLDDFDRGKDGPNVFDVLRVREATDTCRKIRNDLEILKNPTF
ncbi:MAG: hypothetical protein KIT48_15850 [Pseudolabrys sp.]|nr:hypothetical protein [Pseudolabrys sp.]